MGRFVIFSPNLLLRNSLIPISNLPPNLPDYSLLLNSKQKLQHGFQRFGLSIAKPTRSLCTKAVFSEIPNLELYVKVGAKSTGLIPIGQLIGMVEKAAKTGAEVVMDVVHKPQDITYKGLMDFVTELLPVAVFLWNHPTKRVLRCVYVSTELCDSKGCCVRKSENKKSRHSELFYTTKKTAYAVLCLL